MTLPDHRRSYELSRSNAAAVDEEQGRTGDLDVSGRLTIRHPGGGTATIDAQFIDRVLYIQQGAATKLVRIRVTGGDHPLPDPPQMRAGSKRVDSLGDGGGILAESALKLVRSAVVENGGADHGGGIEAFGGPVTLVDSRISRNKTEEGVGEGWTPLGSPSGSCAAQ